MIELVPQSKSSKEPCPYLPGLPSCQDYFLACGLNEAELENLLSTGWRKFGVYFFRPTCPTCSECIPLRVLTQEFSPSKSLRRVKNKNKDIVVRFKKLQYSERIYELYKKHTLIRFPNQTISSKEEFMHSFFIPSTPSMMIEYCLNDALIGVSFLDISAESLSSVYFIYDPDHYKRGLGNFSAITEIEKAKEIGKTYYYLGYYVKGNQSMNYKARFTPHEMYDWKLKRWVRNDKY